MAADPKVGVLIELDDRRRATLGRIARFDRYLAREEDDGTIVMIPAVVMTVADVERINGAPEPTRTRSGKAKMLKPEPEPVPEPATVPAQVPETLREQILRLVRAAGPGGIRATGIVRGVQGARSSTFLELSRLRDAGYVRKNPAGGYEPISTRARKAS
jgi:hypothetical protein